MRPLPYVFPYAVVFWGVLIWTFWPESHITSRASKSVSKADSPDGGSYWLIAVGMLVAEGIAFPLALVPYSQFPACITRPTFFTGIALLVGGSILRRHCFRMLGASFTGDIQVYPDQALVTDGAYALLRHPSYSGGVLINTGIGLALGSWGSTLLLVMASFSVYTYRMAVEERVLLAALGDRYREYVRTRKRLIPYIY